MLLGKRVPHIPEGKTIACDTETTGLYPWNGSRPFFFSFCNESGETGFIHWKVDPFTREPKVNKSDLQEMQDFFGNDFITKVFHNSKFDLRMLEFTGIKVRGRVEDTYFAAHTLRSNELTFGLKALAKKYLDFADDDEKALHKATASARLKGKKLGWNLATKGRDGKEPVKADYWMAPAELIREYACGDVERTMLLWKIFHEELTKDPACFKFYERELRLQRVTMRLESRGVRVKRKVVRQEIQSNQEEIARCKLEFENKIWKDFNPNSTQQVQKLVYGRLKQPVQFWTDSGRPSVNSEALQAMRHPLVQTIQRHNSCEKAISNFFQKYLDNSHKDPVGEWILHPDFNQVGPATGRYSCKNPNLQNVANALTTRSEIPIQARTPFCPRQGYIWLSIDYASQEVWVFADGAQEKNMLEALYAGRDLHSEAADYVWGKGTVAREKAEGKKTSRAKAKMLLFGILYGMGIRSMSAFLKCDRSESEIVLQKYYDLFPRIPAFMREIVEKVEDQGYIETAWGRKIFVDRDFAYKATNYYVQGTGADVIKSAMLRVSRFLRNEELDAQIVMTIHDELVIEIKTDQLRQHTVSNIKAIMEDHQGHLGIEKLPVELALVRKSWNLKEEKVRLEDLPK